MTRAFPIRIERDPAFWAGVAQHPEVARRIGAIDAETIAQLVSLDRVIPLASANGGFLLSANDATARIYELHTMFTPAAWFPSREVRNAAAAMFYDMFEWRGAHLIYTFEAQDNVRSKPPKTFGFAAVGDFEPSDLGRFKTWFLTREAWRASAACLRDQARNSISA